MKHIIARIRYFATHRFVRNAAILQVGMVGSTVVQAASGVVIARLLRPDLFGQYAIAFSIASIVTVFLGAGVQDAVAPQAARSWATGDRAAFRQALGFWAKFTMANIVATCVAVAILPFITAHLYQSSLLGGYADIIILASLVSTTVFTVTQLVLQISGRINALSALTFADAFTRYALSIILLATGFGLWGVMSGHLIGALGMLGIAVIIYQNIRRAAERVPSLTELFALVRRTTWKPLLRPTLWVMADRNLGMLYGALPVAIVGLYVTGAEVAYFKLAFGYIMLAMSVVGPVSTLLNVHFPNMQVADVRRLRSSFTRVTFYSVLLTTGITAIVLAIAPLVFRVLYGAAYLPSVRYVYGLAFFGALFGLGVGLGPLWRAIGRMHVSVLINVITLGIGIPLGIILIEQWQLWGAVAMVTLWYTAAHAISFWYLTRSLRTIR